MENNFDLDHPILTFSSPNGPVSWSVRNAVESVLILGGVGSGKTSGSANTLILKYLSEGFSGLVLTVKADEKAAWQEYCRKTGREKDLVILGPGSGHYFNFLEYESQSSNGVLSLTENIVEVLKTVIQASKEKTSGKGEEQFWQDALHMLLVNTLDLCKLAYGKVSIENVYKIIQTIPKSAEDSISAVDETKPKTFQIALQQARLNVQSSVDEWLASLPPTVQEELEDGELFEAAILEALPDARLLRSVDEFFTDFFIPLPSKTRAICDFSISGFLFNLLRDPVYSLFCRYPSTVTPESCLDGKIILIDLPVKIYNKVGRDCQILFKYIWQRAMEKRDTSVNGRPLFLWADEAQNFLHSHDSVFQSTSRSSRISTVYISQNLPNFYAMMGGDGSDHRVKSFLGTLGTKIFHANADIETNKYASELIGEAFFEDQSDSVTYSQQFSKTKSKSLKLDRIVRPEEFARLRTGGPDNEYLVEAYIHVQGNTLAKTNNHLKVIFNQNYKPKQS